MPWSGDLHTQQALTGPLKEALDTPPPEVVSDLQPPTLFSARKVRNITASQAGVLGNADPVYQSVATYTPAATEPSVSQWSLEVTETLSGFSPSLQATVEVT